MKTAWISVGFAIASLGVGVGASQAENPDHVRTLLQTNSCKGCDLSEASLSGLDLRDADLAGANLEGTDLSGTQLSRANLQKANLTNATITNAVFTGANLQNATLADANNMGLCQGNFLTGFSSRDSQESTCLMLSLLVSFGPEELCQPEYGLQELDSGNSFCRMMGDKNFPASSFFRSSISTFLKSTSFHSADLTNTNLDSVDLSGADFRYATLRNTNMQNATLDYANLINADVQTIPQTQLTNALVQVSDVKTLIQNAIAKEKDARRKKIGRQSIGTLLRAQQAYQLENGNFADEISQLDTYLESQEDYTYTIVPQADSRTGVAITAISQASDLKSYVGILAQEGDSLRQLTCETIEPSKTLPSLGSQLNAEQCPAGTQPVE